MIEHSFSPELSDILNELEVNFESLSEGPDDYDDFENDQSVK